MYKVFHYRNSFSMFSFFYYFAPISPKIVPEWPLQAYYQTVFSTVFIRTLADSKKKKTNKSSVLRITKNVGFLK